MIIQNSRLDPFLLLALIFIYMSIVTGGVACAESLEYYLMCTFDPSQSGDAVETIKANFEFQYGVFEELRNSDSINFDTAVKYSKPKSCSHVNDVKKSHFEFTKGKYKGACYDYHVNIELHGGSYFLGCEGAAIHKDHPNAARFTEIEWVKSDPGSFIDGIRSYYASKGEYRKRIGQISDEFFYWDKIKQIIHSLVGIQDGIRLEHANLVVVEGEKPIDIYRFALIPHDYCLSPDSTVGVQWNYFTYSDHDISKFFNEKMSSANYYILKYEGDVFFANRYGVYRFVLISKGKYVFRTICSFRSVD